MCGLTGIVGSIEVKHEKAFRTMLVLDSLRGEHSTGVYAVARHTDPLLMKKVGSPYELFETAVWEKAFKRQSMCLLGHNRYATTGAVNRENAHPFDFDSVVGAHNGTLTNKWELPHGNEFAVDSQVLYYNISEYGLKESIKKAKGAWALTWWNTEQKTINFLRNKERPLWLAFTADNKNVMWASEKWMIYVAASRENIAIQDPWELPVDTHFYMEIPQSGKELPEFTEEDGVIGAPFAVNTGFINHQQQKKEEDKPKGGKVVPILDPKEIQEKMNKGEMEALGNTKGKTFLVDALHKDANGAWYAECIYPKAAFPVRLYLKSEKEYAFIDGEYIRADVGPLFRSVANEYYYKLNSTSYTILQVEEAMEARAQEEVKSVTSIRYLDKKGNEISQLEWEKNYGTCCWCNGNVSPTSKYRWAHYADTTVCEDCAEDSEVMGYLS